MRGAAETPTAAGYGRLAIATLAGVTATSAAGLTIALAVIVGGERRVGGLPYGDVPLALAAIGGAASLACLASAAAYAAEVSQRSGAAGRERAFKAATVALMTGGYLAFALGGGVFSHFCLAATRALSHAGPAG